MLWLQFIPHTLPVYTELYNIQGRGPKRFAIYGLNCHVSQILLQTQEMSNK